MSDTTAPQGGVSNTPTAQPGASKTGSTEPATVQDGGTKGDLPGFNAGWSKASEKYEAKLAAEKQRAEALEKELTTFRNNGLSAEELRKATEEAQTKAKQTGERFDQYATSVKEYFEARVAALPQDFKDLMADVPSTDFQKYVKTIEKFERLSAATATPQKPAPQGGAVSTQTGDSELLTEYFNAKKSGDYNKLRVLWSDPSKKKAIETELALRSKR